MLQGLALKNSLVFTLKLWKERLIMAHLTIDINLEKNHQREEEIKKIREVLKSSELPS